MHRPDLDDPTIVTDIEFALADAEWRHEVGKILGRSVEDDELVSTLCKGEAGTPLRQAFEARQQAFKGWRAARGIP